MCIQHKQYCIRCGITQDILGVCSDTEMEDEGEVGTENNKKNIPTVLVVTDVICSREECTRTSIGECKNCDDVLRCRSIMVYRNCHQTHQIPVYRRVVHLG